MATNIETSYSSEEEIPNPSSNENDPIREAKQLGANLSKRENAAIARKRDRKDPRVSAWQRV